MHFDKENDCIKNLVSALPPYWRRDFITFYFVKLLLFYIASMLHGFASFIIVFKITSTKPEWN